MTASGRRSGSRKPPLVPVSSVKPAPAASSATDTVLARVLDRLFDLADGGVLRDRRRDMRFERQGGTQQRLRRDQRDPPEPEALELAAQRVHGARAPGMTGGVAY